MADTKTFYVGIIVNTVRLMDEYLNPSTDPKNPTAIPYSHLYVMGKDNAGIFHGIDSGNLAIQASPDDELCIHATSESRNFLNPVVLHQGLVQSGASGLLPNFTLRVSETATVHGQGRVESQNGKAHFSVSAQLRGA